MKKSLTLIVVLLVYLINTSFITPAAELVIEVNNLRNSKGFVLISLFNDEKDFPEKAEKAVRKAKVKIKDRTASISFNNLPAGKYACAILHDENDNYKMDFNILGMPKEGYGFSNNAKGLFGPPSFSKASFVVADEVHKISIRTIYF